MDRATVLVTIVSIISGKMFVLAGLWLRLRWRTRHEQVQRQRLTLMTQSINDGGDVEIMEQRPDGHSVRITMTRTPRGKTAA